MNRKKFLIYILTVFIVISAILPIVPSFAVEEEPVVDAPVALLMESETGKILYEKDSDKKMYPASTTKIMTAILALENRSLTDTAQVSYDAIFTVPVRI